ncbi:MAG: hypothetical protein RJB62_1344 [Pseudomonadota bacterium]|jgi:hypothetical protein
MSGSNSYRPKFGFDIRIKPEGPKTQQRKKVKESQRCGISGCVENAEWKVPKSRQNMDERVWLCREHLRLHNENWNFFEGMSDEDVEKYCIDASFGHRPTWPLGQRGAGSKAARPPKGQKNWNPGVDDRFQFFEEAEAPKPPPRQTLLTKGQLDALEALGLEESATLSQVKAKYKELVKRFHPDTNGGDRGKEERLKQVIKAYGHLRATGFARANP